MSIVQVCKKTYLRTSICDQTLEFFRPHRIARTNRKFKKNSLGIVFLSTAELCPGGPVRAAGGGKTPQAGEQGAGPRAEDGQAAAAALGPRSRPVLPPLPQWGHRDSYGS